MSDAPNTGLARQQQRGFSLMPATLGEAKELASIISKSGFAPKGYENNPDGIVIAIQMGADLGLKPMQALQNIAVINGRPSIYGDAALALAMDVLEKFTEDFTGTFPNDDFTAVCTSKRKGWPDETVRTFSIADAKKAGLWDKAGPWKTYPKRMLQFRARGFNLRDVASDRLLGLVLAEEAQDFPSIEGTVVASEVVEQPKALTIFEQQPEGVRDNIEKAFATMNFAHGARLAKLNEWFGGDGIDPDQQAIGLLDWLKDEFAKRKTGQARAKKDEGNGKKKSENAPDATKEKESAKGTNTNAGAAATAVAGTAGSGGSGVADPSTAATSTAPASPDLF